MQAPSVWFPAKAHTHTHFNSISEVVTKLEQITRGHCTCGNQGFPELVYLGHPNNETWPSCGMEQHYRILSPHCIDLEQDFHEDDDHNMRSSQARPRCMFMCTYVYMHIYISGEFAFELVFAKAIKHFTYLFQNKHWCWCGDKSSPMTADKSNNIICSVFETCSIVVVTIHEKIMLKNSLKMRFPYSIDFYFENCFQFLFLPWTTFGRRVLFCWWVRELYWTHVFIALRMRKFEQSDAYFENKSLVWLFTPIFCLMQIWWWCCWWCWRCCCHGCSAEQG